MDKREKRLHIIMAIFFFLAMLAVVVFTIQKNQNAENKNVTSPSPVVETTGI